MVCAPASSDEPAVMNAAAAPTRSARLRPINRCLGSRRLRNGSILTHSPGERPNGLDLLRARRLFAASLGAVRWRVGTFALRDAIERLVLSLADPPDLAVTHHRACGVRMVWARRPSLTPRDFGLWPGPLEGSRRPRRPALGRRVPVARSSLLPGSNVIPPPVRTSARRPPAASARRRRGDSFCCRSGRLVRTVGSERSCNALL